MNKSYLLYFGILIILFSFTTIKNSNSNSEGEFHKSSTISNDFNDKDMKLGAFSISLSVKDLKASKEFYKKLGFSVLAGDFEKNYFILKNGNSLIGIFHGMFENNILTFNPGWDESGQNISEFDDIREIQRQLKAEGVVLDGEADASIAGPANIMLKDPDGNVIFIDQHR